MLMQELEDVRRMKEDREVSLLTVKKQLTERDMDLAKAQRAVKEAGVYTNSLHYSYF